MKDEGKECTKCGECKSPSEFYDNSGNTCKKCKNQYNKEWRVSNREEHLKILKRNMLKRNYGISEEQYEELLQKQNECCAVCERHKSAFKIRLAVDHDHHTGEIRGLLCNNCNHRFIGRHRDGNLFRKAADYLDQGTGLFVPDDKIKGQRKRRKRKTKKNG